jgi:Tfp pilus assembly protein PilN
MKAVNLVPSDARNSSGPSLKMAPVTYALLGVLTAAVALVSLYVLASNNVNSRRNQMASLESQLTQAQSEATQLGSYGQFTALAQTRLQTVRGIAATRFDWHGALAELSRVIPTNTSLQSLNGTVVPGAGASAGGGGSSNLRPDLEGPAFELTGCTHTQDDVARLISRLRVMTGVQRVALGTSRYPSTRAVAR